MFLCQPWWGAVAPYGAGLCHPMQGCPQISGTSRGSEEFLSSSMCLAQSKSLPFPHAKKNTLYVGSFNTQNTCLSPLLTAALVFVCRIPEEGAVSSRPLAVTAWGGSCLGRIMSRRWCSSDESTDLFWGRAWASLCVTMNTCWPRPPSLCVELVVSGR